MRRCCLLVLILFPASARAEDPNRPREPLPMREMSVADAAFWGVLSAGILTAALVPGPPAAQPGWRGGILFDDGVRGALMLGSPGERRVASRVSDGLVLGLTAISPILDAAVMAWLVRGDPELAGRLLLIDLQAHAFAQGLTTLVKRLVGRERPLARGCREDPARAANDPSCEGHIEPESFFSGHTSLAFTSASLVCLHHTELGLLGREGDAAMCATGLALASTVGVLRVAADRHYASDVILGAGVGILSGWLVPWLFHYDVAQPTAERAFSATVAPMVDEDRIGAQIFGIF